ncbi:MAG: glycine/sarcosine/betaine reductase selenoprotein B family protein [Candidatus Promineifilaceae bacterium]
MEILENIEQWEEQYNESWLAHYLATGKPDWSQYHHPRNEAVPGVPGVRLAESRLMVISTAGAYIPGEQTPFDAPNLMGDYTLRTFPSDFDLARLAFAHEHYDHAMINEDVDVALPLSLLAEMVEAGQIGRLTPSVVSISGYHPNSAQVVREVAPKVVAIAREEGTNAALLAPM